MEHHRLGRMARASVCALLLVAGAAQADERQKYEVFFNGVRGGTLTLDASIDGQTYRAEGRVESSGLFGRFVRFAFAGRVAGTILGSGTLRPADYAGLSTTGQRSRAVRMRYRGGVPQSVSFDPKRDPRSWDADPSAQRGTRDPISATLEILRSAPAGRACGKTVEIFDGTKRSRIRIGSRQRQGDRWACGGVYSRVQGWPADELAEQTDFRFVLFFREDAAGMMRADGFESQTIYGPVRAVRR